MNTDNKIAVSDKRELRKTLSGGVRDLSQVGHFPALTAAQAPSVGARKLQRMSSSFKDVVRTETEAQELPVILEASADSTAVPSGSPRIGVRYQQAALEQQQDEQSFRPKQFRPSVSSKVCHAVLTVGQSAEPTGPFKHVSKPQILSAETQKQLTHLALQADVDEEGFQTPRSRKTRSPKATVDVDAQPAIQTSFGIPAHDNTFSLLADSRSRTTTSGSEVNIAAMADSASESVHSADGAEALSTSFEPRGKASCFMIH